MYIYIQAFSNIFHKIGRIYKKQSIPRENDENHCVFSLKRMKTNHFVAFAQIFRAFRPVFAEITLFGNDNGEFIYDFVAEQTTHKLDRGVK